MTGRSRRWCFTLNNWTEEEYIAIENCKCSYLVVGKEVGEEETPHLQGYIEFDNAKTLSAAKKVIGKRAHLESAKGTPTQASDYCKKDGDFLEKGELSHQGARKDLVSLAERVRTGGVQAVVDESPDMFLQFGSNVLKLATYYQKHRTEAPAVTWLWGASGVGKTRMAIGKGDDYYIWNGSKFWCGYEQQHIVVIDDFTYDRTQDPGSYHYRYLLRLMDRYELNVEIKGGHIKFNSPVIYITCEYHPSHFWAGNEYDQVVRRLIDIRELKEDTFEEAESSDWPSDTSSLPPQREDIEQAQKEANALFEALVIELAKQGN